MGEYPWRDAERMYEMYVKQGMSTYKIAEEVGCTRSTIGKWLRRHDIKTRGETVSYGDDEPWKDEETLRELYCKETLSMRKIGDKFDCHEDTIELWLNKFNIDKRAPGQTNVEPRVPKERLVDLYEDRGMSINEIANEVGSSHDTVSGWLDTYNIEKRDPNPRIQIDEEDLRRLYVDERLPQREIAKHFDCSYYTISDRIDEYGISIDRPWRDEELLREMYLDRGMTQKEIADEFGCTDVTICTWINKFDIPTSHDGVSGVYYISCEKYDSVRVIDVDSKVHIAVHRFVKYAHSDADFSEFTESHCHHKNGIPWDNRPENLELVSPDEHTEIHLDHDHWKDAKTSHLKQAASA